MQNAYLLSVIIPMYQAEKYILGTLWSLIRQRESHRLEIICVDDGSEDDTVGKCRMVMAEWPNIRLICLPHGGVSKARNAGLREATAPYAAFLDADDCWEEDFFDAEMVGLLEKGYDVLGFGWATTSIHPEKNRVFSVPDALIPGGTALAEMEPRSFCAYFYKKELLDTWNIRFPEDISYNEDELFKLYCLYHGSRIRFFPRILFTNRLHANSLRSGRYSETGKYQLIQVWQRAMAYFADMNPPAENMVAHCRETLEKLLDKMNRESCRDAACVAAAEPGISREYAAYAYRAAADAAWHERIFGGAGKIRLMAPCPELENKLRKVFTVDILSPKTTEPEISDGPLVCLFPVRSFPDVTVMRSAAQWIPGDVLVIFDFCGVKWPLEEVRKTVRSAAQHLTEDKNCLVGYCAGMAGEKKKIVGGSQALACDRIFQIYSAIEPGNIRLLPERE